jgi:hypothetical protein
MANNVDKNEKETSLIRVGERAKDIVRRHAFEKKITIKEYVEQLIYKAEEETQKTKRKENKMDERDTDLTETKIRFEGHIYIGE